ncbi:MAG: large subunit ribosomal protein L18 [Planctomycetota bacterium]|jgi:large subunit ribosomal protein L18
MANRIVNKRRRLLRRKRSVRKNISGTGERPRLTVFRTSKHIYVQVIDDMAGRTMCSSSTVDKGLRSKISFGGNATAAKAVGEDIAEKVLAAGVNQIIFDRNGYRYQGRLQALADAAREKGLDF